MKQIVARLALGVLLGMASSSQTAEGKWTRKTDMPTPRVFLSTCVVNGQIYAIGGQIDNYGDKVVGSVEAYDPATDTWTKKADMPTARSTFSTNVVNGKIYAIGGWSNRQAIATVEEYDPKTDTWTKKADMPTARWGLSTAVVNRKIYAIGGANDYDGNQVLGVVEEYDPVTNTWWTKKANMPTKRHSFATGVVNGKIYAIGGSRENHVGLSTVEVYDPAADTWTKGTDMPIARVYLSPSAPVVKGRIYVMGGEASEFLPTVEAYNPVMDTWTKEANMPNQRMALATSAVNGKIYAIGGQLRVGSVEEYTPEGER